MASKTYSTFEVSPVGASKHAIRITISNPPINLVNHAFLSDILAFLNTIKKDTNPPKVVVVASADPEIWISHLDLHAISAKYPLPTGQDSGQVLKNLGKVLHAFNSLPTIFIAEVNGRAVGGGNEFALNMDMRFAGPGAIFGIPEVAGGVIHGGALQRLVQVIGAPRAMEWHLSARAIAAEEAAKIGWVNSAHASAKALRVYVDALAVQIAGYPRGGIVATKESIGEALSGEGSVQKDLHRLKDLAHTEEAQRAISGFIELGEDQSRSAFELGLPDTVSQIWHH